MIRLFYAAAVAAVCASAAGAQTLAQTLTSQLGGQVLTLREIGADNRPTGPELTMRIFASGAAQMILPGTAEPNWAIWRVSDGGAFCTTQAIEPGGSLIPAGQEDCVALQLEGDSLRLTYARSTGGTEAYEGTMRPM